MSASISFLEYFFHTLPFHGLQMSSIVYFMKDNRNRVMQGRNWDHQTIRASGHLYKSGLTALMPANMLD